jgi:hypothetical protein
VHDEHASGERLLLECAPAGRWLQARKINADSDMFTRRKSVLRFGLRTPMRKHDVTGIYGISVLQYQ